MELLVPACHLTMAQVGFYALNGYLVVENILPSVTNDALLFLARSQADEKFSAIMNLDRTTSEFRSLMTHPEIVGILERLQGKEIVALMSQILFKEAHSEYATQAWNPHQDNSYARSRPGTYLTINIFFADSEPENGGLYIYPGSHREGLLPFEPVLSYREKPGSNPGNWIKEPRLEKYAKVDLHIRKGGMLILAGECVHGSYANTSNRSRPLFSASYLNFGEPFWPGHPARSDKKIILLHE